MLNLQIASRGMLLVAAPVVLLLVSTFLAPSVARGEEALAERKARILEMSPAKKETLRRKKERFDKFDEEKREKLRQIQRDIDNDPKALQLTAVMKGYHRWLTTLTAVERDELRSLQGQARVERIKELMERQWHDRIRGVAFSRQERERVYRWLVAYFKNHEPELLFDLPDDARQEVLEHKDSPFFHMILLSWWKRHVGVKKSLPLDEQEIEQFQQVLPEDAQKLFDEITDLRLKQELAAVLILASLPRSVGSPARGRWHPGRRRPGWGPRSRVSREDLQTFFENELTADERRDVTRHHGDEIHRELMKLYFKKNFPSRRGGDRRGSPQRSPRERRPDRRGGDGSPPKDRPPRGGPDRGLF